MVYKSGYWIMHFVIVFTQYKYFNVGDLNQNLMVWILSSIIIIYIKHDY